MARIYHCAECGTQLDFHRKAIRGGTIFNLIAPHTCGKTVELKEFKTVKVEVKPIAKMDKLFDGFPFVDKINKASPNLPDKRPADNLRKELSTTAPVNLVKMAKNILTTPTSGRELEDPSD